uniref:Uncharacterized protein n=1 Tax=Oryza barthii TaxID=65489 RepID=A0A0D3HEG5_9ORYZ
MVWPSPLKFIGELEPEAKALLEAALMEANREREKKILNGTKYSLPSPLPGDDSADDDACSEVSDMSSAASASTRLAPLRSPPSPASYLPPSAPALPPLSTRVRDWGGTGKSGGGDGHDD